MKKIIFILLILLCLSLIIWGHSPATAQDLPLTPIKMKTLAWQDNRVYGDSFVNGEYVDGEYIDIRSPVSTWTIEEPIAIVGSKVYVEVHPIWRPNYHKGNLECEVELSKSPYGADHTINKVDLKIVIGDVQGVCFHAGPWVGQEVIMFPAGSGIICEVGEQISLICDGKNLIMAHENAVVMYFRAYIFYVEL